MGVAERKAEEQRVHSRAWHKAHKVATSAKMPAAQVKELTCQHERVLPLHTSGVSASTYGLKCKVLHMYATQPTVSASALVM